jgi:hypothetical protein
MEELMTHRNSDDLKHLLGDDSPFRKAVTIDVKQGYFHTNTLKETHSPDSIRKFLGYVASN